MEYTLDKQKGSLIVANIHVGQQEWDEALNSSYEKNKRKYNLPGFRKGHAPRNMIEKAYGAGAFVEGALDEVYYKAYTLVLRENQDIKPVDSPKLEIKQVGETGVDLVLSIPCVPTFELAQYKGLTFTKQEVKVTDKDVQDAIDRELLRASRLVETKKPVKNEDFVNLNFDGYIDGKPFDGGKAENYQLKIGSHTFIGDFEEQLIGLNVGDKKDVVVTFPADYHEESLRNKPATFKCEIKAVRERVTPKLDEEFVSNSTEFSSVDEFKKSIADRLNKEANDRAEIELDNDMLDKLVDDTELTPPEVLVDEELNRQLNGIEMQMKYQGITLEDYVKYIGKSMDDFKAEVRTNATRNVKARLVLEKLIRVENLDISQEEIDKKLIEMAKNSGKTLEEIKREDNNNMVNRVANEMLMKKITEFLRANNTIK